LEAALLCFQPRTLTCSNLTPFGAADLILACESMAPKRAFWMLLKVRSRSIAGFLPEEDAVALPVSPRPRLPPRPLSDIALMSKSPSRSILVEPRFRMPPRSVGVERPPRVTRAFPILFMFALDTFNIAFGLDKTDTTQ